MVRINGKEESVCGMRLYDYLVQNQYSPEGIAVECNEEILPKDQYQTYVLKDDDVIEIVSFVGGG
ncbi:MAG: sulfur carrier protein ThiS [Eubacterium sp.]|nr:sulfur carrier protein ThiS [Eubacterium sp.]